MLILKLLFLINKIKKSIFSVSIFRKVFGNISVSTQDNTMKDETSFQFLWKIQPFRSREQHTTKCLKVLLSIPFTSISSSSAIRGIRGGGRMRVSSMSRGKVTGAECLL